MPQSFVNQLASLVISSGGTGSSIVSGIKAGRALGIWAPGGGATLTGTVKLQVYPTGGSTTPRDLTSAGADIVIQAGDCLVLTDIVYPKIRLLSSLAEGAARTFIVTQRWES